MDELRIIQRLIEIHGNSMSALCGKLVQANARLPILHNLLKPLEELGETISDSNGEIARIILDTAYALQIEVFFFEKDNSAIVEYSAKGLSVASPAHRSYYCFALSGAESFFKLNDPESAFRLLGSAISASLTHGCEEREVPGFLKFMSRWPLEAFQVPEFTNALSGYAEKVHGIMQSDLESMWKTDPVGTIRTLLARV